MRRRGRDERRERGAAGGVNFDIAVTNAPRVTFLPAGSRFVGGEPWIGGGLFSLQRLPHRSSSQQVIHQELILLEINL